MLTKRPAGNLDDDLPLEVRNSDSASEEVTAETTKPGETREAAGTRNTLAKAAERRCRISLKSSASVAAPSAEEPDSKV